MCYPRIIINNMITVHSKYLEFKKISILIFLSIFFFSCMKKETGKSYRGWEKGELDIHHIYTGRGESSFLIFPDGTSLLIDAGDFDPDNYLLMTPAFPDTSRRSGEWIARYIERINPHKKHVDYFMLSHFHDDHYGGIKIKTRITSGRDPNYILAGISETSEYINFNKLIDRDYPNYNFPNVDNSADFVNYKKFVEWKVKSKQFQAERFEVGKNNQIVMQYEPELFPEFEIQNIVSSGAIWTGQEQNVDSLISDKNKNRYNNYSENTLSSGIRLSFGAFRYYTAGDLSRKIPDIHGNDIEIDKQTALVCGEVDVCKVNHHGYLDAMSEGFIREICASQYIFPVWDYQHVQTSIIERVSSRDLHKGKTSQLFFTYIAEDLRSKCNLREWGRQIAPENGHVIVKVFNNGEEYKIYIVSAINEKMIVKEVYGPYYSKKSKLNF